MLLKDLLKGIEYEISGGTADIDIKSVTDDSRQVRPGGLFIAVAGHSQDGRKFADSAVSNGAIVVVSDQKIRVPGGVLGVYVKDIREALSAIAVNFYDAPSRKLGVIGITGTNGKTTITYLIESIAKSAGFKSGVIGTVNYRIAGSSRLAKNTTPGALELQSLLSEMVGAGCSYAAIEVSSHALEQGRVSGVYFDAAIFTNITSDHLDYHKTPEKYFEAKMKIFDHLKDGGTAILNNDDQKIRSVAPVIKHKKIAYGTKPGSTVAASKIKLSPDGSSFDAVTPSGVIGITTKLLGMHNVSNCLAAIAAMQVLGVDAGSIAKGIKDMETIPGRLEPVDRAQSFKVLVDYAHTEDALNNVLSILKNIGKGKVITVFGCGGDRDRSKRPLMCRAACKYSDRVIITSDNPRSEDQLRIIDEIESGIRAEFSNYDIVPDRRDAIIKAISLAEDGDIVLIAGKGHEDYQIVGERVLHFDDREVADEALRSILVKT